MLHYALIMVAAGIGIPVLAALNAALGRQIGSPAMAAAVLFVVAFGIAALAALITQPQAITRLGAAPKYLFLAGTLVAFYILSITWIAPVIGVGNAVFCVLLGQLISAAVIDHYGLFSAQVYHLTPSRAAGIALMAAGVLLTQKA